MKTSTVAFSVSDVIHVRRYRDEDLPEVLSLLRAALGETELLMRTPELFQWKHQRNPFGRSVMLVAVVDDVIVGLRTLMRWDLVFNDEVIHCGRAVDTATHPDYRRMGIFRQLTFEALDVARDVGIQLIFNTPNERSRPGYLKMGWSSVGPIRALVRPHPTKLGRARSPSFPTLDDLAPAAIPITSPLPEVVRHLDGGATHDGLHTRQSPEYFLWRFAEHPSARYGAVVGQVGMAIVRANLRNGRSELVISDALGIDPTEAIGSAARTSRASYDVAAFPKGSMKRRAAYRAGMLPLPGIAALDLVAKPLGDLVVDVLDPRVWQLSLSDLELL